MSADMYTRIQLIVVFTASLVMLSTCMPAAAESMTVKRLPYVFIDGGILADGTIVGVTPDRMLVFVKDGVVKKVPLLMKSTAHVVLYPRDEPSEVMVWTDAGDVVVTDSSGNILYRKVIGFGSLQKACYAAGNIYMLISTPRGPEVWLYSMHTRSWFYVGAGEIEMKNAERLLWGTPVDIACGEDGAVVLYMPILPPSVESYLVTTIMAVNASTNEPVPSVSILVYMPEYNFSVTITTDESGVAKLYLPWPIKILYIYYEYKNIWYLKVSHISAPSDLLSGIVLLVPGNNVVAPPPVSPTSYVVVLRGAQIEKTLQVGVATRVLAYGSNVIALYDQPTAMVAIVDLVTGKQYRFGLDGQPTSSDLYGGWMAIGTDKGTLYIVRLPAGLATTLYVGKVLDISVDRAAVAVSTSTGIHVVSLSTLKDIFRYGEPSLPVESPYIYMRDGRLLFSGEDSSVLAYPINRTEPFNFRKLIPYKVCIRVVDPWGNPVPEATVIVDDIVIGKTDAEGVMKLSLGYGSHRIVVTPPPGRDNVTTTEFTLEVSSDTNTTLVLERTVYRVHIRVRDARSPVLSEPVHIVINDTRTGKVILSKDLTMNPAVTVWLKPGEYLVTVTSLAQPPTYEPLREVLKVDGDKDVTLVLRYVKYRIRVNVYALDTGRQLPALVCARNLCTNGTILLPKGEHEITIKPLVFFDNIPLYETVTKKVRVEGNTVLNVTVSRRNYILRIRFVDGFSGGPLETPVGVIVGPRKFANVNGSVVTAVPAGSIQVKIVGNELYAPKTYRLSVTNDMNVTLKVPRRTVSVTVVVNDILGNPATPATLVIKSLDGRYVKRVRVPDTGVVKLMLPSTTFVVSLESPFFTASPIRVDPSTSTTYTMVVMPTVQGWLLKYGTIMMTVVGVIAVTLVIRWAIKRVERRVREVSGQLVE